MRIIVFQPPYPASARISEAETCIGWMKERLNELQPGEQDIALLPEYANVPGLTRKSDLLAFGAKQGAELIEHVKASSTRLGTAILLPVLIQEQERLFNRSLFFAPDGNVICAYDKVHLTDSELSETGITPGYSLKTVEYAGVRFGFAVCFDMYFPEHFEALAAQQTDVLLCPSYQRSEKPWRIRLIAQTRALDTGAYLLRSSYSMGRFDAGGSSLVADPTGAILADAEDKPCILALEIEPKRKFRKPASHNNPEVEHRTLIEQHRIPVAYRARIENVGRLSSIPFPRICAHRGLSKACPENTLPAFAAALATGADELEFDLWMSRDGVAVVCHDNSLARTTNGTGCISDMDWSDICRLDAGAKACAPDSAQPSLWRGVRIPRLEEVLELADGRTALNIHIKEAGPNGRLVCMVCDVLRSRNLTDAAYIASAEEEALQTALEYAPEIQRACLMGQRKNIETQVEHALRFSCGRIQALGEVSREQLALAHEAGLICNYFWSDELEHALGLVAKGIDVILTNSAHTLLAGGFRARAGVVFGK